MRQIKAYSIWLIPEGEIYQNLAKIILQLSEKYSTPFFDPHVTLIGSVIGTEKEILAQTAQLATLISPFKIQLTNLDYSDQYHRCLFIGVAKEASILQANLKSREIFKKESDPKYFPHLSLLYGNLSPKLKELIINGLGRKFNKSFSAKSLHLFSTEGEVKTWQKIAEFKLKLSRP